MKYTKTLVVVEQQFQYRVLLSLVPILTANDEVQTHSTLFIATLLQQFLLLQDHRHAH